MSTKIGKHYLKLHKCQKMQNKSFINSLYLIVLIQIRFRNPCTTIR